MKIPSFSTKTKRKVKEIPPCSHEWKVISKTYAPPTKGVQLPDDVESLQKAILGVTSYMWQCSFCNEFKIQEMFGSDTNQLAEILERVKVFGPQYLEDEDGQSFVVSKAVQTEQIPVR